MRITRKSIINYKTGFTIIELLGVILLLGIISLITVPAVSNVIQESKQKAFKASAIYIFQAATMYIYDNNYYDMPAEGIEVTILDNIDPNPFISGYIFKNASGKYELAYVSDGKYCANGEKTRLVITKGTCDI